jgi:hypothetical protein
VRPYRQILKAARGFVRALGQSRLSCFLTATVVLAGAARLEAAVVTDTFLEAVAQIESSGGRYNIGDGGRAHGAWQMHAGAWKDTTAYRKQRGEPVWSYSQAHNTTVARLYARDYLTLLEGRLYAALKREPSAEMVYAAYNMGFSRFAGLGFRLDNAPRTTRLACVRLRPVLDELNRSVEKSLVRDQTN